MQASVSPGSLPDSSPLVSIVLPSYNGERFLARSIESCLNQTYRNIQLILVDDCSVDDTYAIMKEYAAHDQRITVLHNERNLHIAASLDKGFSIAQGKYHTWTSDDNYYEPQAIEEMIKPLEGARCDLAYAASHIINVSGEYIGTYIPEDNIEELLIRNIIGACFLYRNEVYKKNEGYDITKPLVEDYCFWLTTFKNKFIFFKLNTILYNYTVHENSLSAQKANEVIAARFLLHWEFRALTDRVSSKMKKTFWLNLYSESRKLRMERWGVLLRSFPFFPAHCVKGELKSLLIFIKKLFWQQLPCGFRGRVKAVVEYLRANSPFALKVAKTVPKNPKIGFAVLSHERPEYLKICLDTLFASDIEGWDVTFLIHDDGSTDPKVREVIEGSRDPKYKIERVYKPKGHNSWGAAFNSAMRELRKIDDFDILGSCDSDALFHPEWLQQTLPLYIWAKKHHRHHMLGPFSPFNSSDIAFHKSLGEYASPYGRYVIKERMGALVYLFFRDDFDSFGVFAEDKDDETLKTAEMQARKIRNISSSISYIEHIGQESVLNAWRPTPVSRAVYGLSLAPSGWSEHLRQVGTLGYFKSVAPRTGMEPGKVSARKLDIIIPATEKDLPVLPLTIEGVQKNLNHPIGQIYVVAPESHAIKAAALQFGAFFVDEREVAPISKSEIQYSVAGHDRSGWMLQQLIKLNGDKLSSNSHYFVIDADTVLVRKQVFEENGKMILLVSDEFHQPYYRIFKRLFGASTSSLVSFVSHMMCFDVHRVKELKDVVENQHAGNSWWEAILYCLDKTELSGFSEYELYGNWMLNTFPDDITREYYMNKSLSRESITSLKMLEAIYSHDLRSISFHDYIP